MAKWGGLPTKSKRPPVKKYLYLQCDCEDFNLGLTRGQSLQEAFLIRRARSVKRGEEVYVARTTDFLIPPEMSEDREPSRCVWRNELGQYVFLAVTLGRIQRTHKVYATIDGGLETEWVCKHGISVARYVGRRMWNTRHLFVHLANDPYIKDLLKWHEHLAGDSWKEPYKMWLTHYVCMTGWGKYDYKSNLFGQTKGKGL